MKKVVNTLLLSFLAFVMVINVNAQEYEKNQLIPVNTSATVHTDKFDYKDLVYNSNVDNKGNANITFGVIQNNTLSKSPVSINMLLFDDNKNNIGFLTYCSDKDVSSNFAGFKIQANQKISFNIIVTSRYFAENKIPADVKYVAVMDENKYCQIGGYDKFAGLTIDQIANGDRSNTKGKNNLRLPNISFLFNTGFLIIAFAAIIVIIIFVVYGTILNTLHKRMYAKKTGLAYLPFTNTYVTAKMAFGPIIAIISTVIFCISVLLAFIGLDIINTLVSVFFFIAFIVDIIKLITKNYDMLYFEPSVKNDNYSQNYSIDGELINSNEPTVDLSYSNATQKPIDLNYEDNEFDNISVISTGVGNNETNTNALEDSISLNFAEEKDNSTANVSFDDSNQSNNNEISTGTNSMDSLYDSINASDDDSGEDGFEEEGDSDLSKLFK